MHTSHNRKSIWRQTWINAHPLSLSFILRSFSYTNHFTNTKSVSTLAYSPNHSCQSYTLSMIKSLSTTKALSKITNREYKHHNSFIHLLSLPLHFISSVETNSDNTQSIQFISNLITKVRTSGLNCNVGSKCCEFDDKVNRNIVLNCLTYWHISQRYLNKSKKVSTLTTTQFRIEIHSEKIKTKPNLTLEAWSNIRKLISYSRVTLPITISVGVKDMSISPKSDCNLSEEELENSLLDEDITDLET